ncbi:MAG: hypothetical protein GXP49_18535 [Deltaproteobacteria bacterium]|nr:hypothetical protein [Deltaproteobacteria bacterium]
MKKPGPCTGWLPGVPGGSKGAISGEKLGFYTRIQYQDFCIAYVGYGANDRCLHAGGFFAGTKLLEMTASFSCLENQPGKKTFLLKKDPGKTVTKRKRRTENV